ncbi:MAG TPA: NAD(P)-dependent oxidoreductase [Solirubrobacteraceae bacterium]|nr:NAD(P)-dependent oxidoreductase [Solirubrobacteraceae bacterium]
MTDGPILILGGAGFVGAATYRALAARGLEPLTADVAGDADHHLDVCDLDAVEALLVQLRPAVVMNFAFRLADASTEALDASFRVNALGAQNALEASRRAGVSRFLFASSIAVYGDQADWGDHELAEADHGRPVRAYGWQKQLQEAMATEYRERFGMTCAGVRVSTVYGRGRSAGLSAPISTLVAPPEDGRVRVPWSPDEGFDLIHVDDVAEVFERLAQAPELPHAIYNSGGDRRTVGELVDEVRRLRPDLAVDFAEPPATLAHCHRIDWSRLRALIGDDRPGIAQRLIAEARPSRAQGGPE